MRALVCHNMILVWRKYLNKRLGEKNSGHVLEVRTRLTNKTYNIICVFVEPLSHEPHTHSCVKYYYHPGATQSISDLQLDLVKTGKHYHWRDISNASMVMSYMAHLS